MKLNIVRLGHIDYGRALMVQEKISELVRSGSTYDTLLILEHPAVLTLGRRGQYENILLPREELEKQGVSIYEVSRGGDVTYHGPGQIVGYPVMNLENYGKDIKQFIWRIEEIFIKLLSEQYGIAAHREENKYTGVWVENEKVTAIGVAVKHWVTTHGFAFNVNTDLEHFKWINPCGITDKGVTSLQKLLGHQLDFQLLNRQVEQYFCDVFGLEPVYTDIEDLIGRGL